MDVDHWRNRQRQLVNHYGEWTAHNIRIADGFYTISEDAVVESRKIRRILQIVSDLSGKPLGELRILDLACLEGQYAIEFARHGAHAVGIEGREASIVKAQFVKDALSLDNVAFYQDDIRNLSLEKYGEFDVVLCLGVFYHLNAPDLFELMDRMYSVCQLLLVMDTFAGVSARKEYEYRGRKYWGVPVIEHSPKSSREERLKDLWASLEDVQSVWLTRPSLINLMSHAGFTSTYECQTPHEIGKPSDRVTLVAVKGQPALLHSVPKGNQSPLHDVPERRDYRINPLQKRSYWLSKMISGSIPRAVKEPLKRVLRGLGIRRPPANAPPWEWKTPWKSRGTQTEHENQNRKP
jgi:SAM-dependent methyltransferase